MYIVLSNSFTFTVEYHRKDFDIFKLIIVAATLRWRQEYRPRLRMTPHHCHTWDFGNVRRRTHEALADYCDDDDDDECGQRTGECGACARRGRADCSLRQIPGQSCESGGTESGRRLQGSADGASGETQARAGGRWWRAWGGRGCAGCSSGGRAQC